MLSSDPIAPGRSTEQQFIALLSQGAIDRTAFGQALALLHRAEEIGREMTRLKAQLDVIDEALHRAMEAAN